MWEKIVLQQNDCDVSDRSIKCFLCFVSVSKDIPLSLDSFKWLKNIIYCQNIVMIIIDTIGWKNYEYGTEYGKKGQK